MNKAYILILFVVFFGAALNSCKFPPTEDMNRAFDAVLRADNDPDAVNYAANTLARARNALSRMQAEADVKRYDEAKNFAAEAISLADRAITEGKTGAARARQDAANILSIVGSEILQTEGEIQAAKNAGNLDLDIDALEQDFASVQNGYGDARQSQSDENYLDAMSKAEPLRPALADIRSSINDAAMDTSRKK